MRGKKGLFQFVHIGVFILSLATDWYAPLVLTLFFSVVIMMLNNLGKGIVLREIIALHSCFVCLLMPLMGYTYFPRTNHLSLLWGKYMPIPADQYFSFTLPAMAGFVVALCWPLVHPKYQDYGPVLQGAMEKVRGIVRHKSSVGVLLISIGIVSLKLAAFMPTALQFVLHLFYFSGFAGLLYIYYAKTFRWRKLVIFAFAIFIVITALSSGMFTIVAYMGLTLFSFFFLGRKANLWRKLFVFCLGVFFLLILQMTKPAFRQKTWNAAYEGNKGELFLSIFMDKLTHFNLESADILFPIYYRTNQGFNIALVMRRFPGWHPFDYGSNLMVSIASAFVPRVLWPDKPEAGGKFNMAYYAGFQIVGWSTNVGPLGEAYGSFGYGGIVFMFLLGLFIRWAYRKIFIVANKLPLLICWVPVFFYQVTYSAETDTLQIMNFLIKSAFFVWILYRVTPGWFKILKRGRPRRSLIEAHNGLLTRKEA
jgi:hypothetical protein